MLKEGAHPRIGIERLPFQRQRDVMCRDDSPGGKRAGLVRVNLGLELGLEGQVDLGFSGSEISGSCLRTLRVVSSVRGFC